jgi:hypothetical protein
MISSLRNIIRMAYVVHYLSFFLYSLSKFHRISRILVRLTSSESFGCLSGSIKIRRLINRTPILEHPKRTETTQWRPRSPRAHATDDSVKVGRFVTMPALRSRPPDTLRHPVISHLVALFVQCDRTKQLHYFCPQALALIFCIVKITNDSLDIRVNMI